jgi:hypothetical protein
MATVTIQNGFERELPYGGMYSFPTSTVVLGGEYPDEPEIVVVVHNAVDYDGKDVSQDLAARIAAVVEEFEARTTAAYEADQ